MQTLLSINTTQQHKEKRSGSEVIALLFPSTIPVIKNSPKITLCVIYIDYKRVLLYLLNIKVN